MDKDERLLPVPTSKDLPSSTRDSQSSYPPVYGDDFVGNRKSFVEYLNVVTKRLPLILAMTIAVTAVTAFYMYRQPSVFQATTRMVIEPRKPKVQQRDAININLGNDPQYLNTQLQLLQNQELLRSAVVRLGLHKDPNALVNDDAGIIPFFKKLFGSKKDVDSGGVLPEINSDIDSASQDVQLSAEERQRADSYAAILRSGLTVEPVDRTSIVNVSIKSTNPEVAAKVADSVAELFIQRNAEQEVQGAQKAFEQLTKSIEDLKATIVLQEQEFIKQMESAQLPITPGKGSDLLAQRMQAYSAAWINAQEERRKLEVRLNSIIGAKGDGRSVREGDDDKASQDLSVRLQEAQSQLADLRVKYTDENEKIKQLIAKIESLKKSESDSVVSLIAALRSQITAALKREGEAREAYFSEVGKANVQGQAETRLTTLKREIETNRGLLDTYTQRQKEQELAIASGRPDNMRIDAAAIRPSAPVGPMRNRNILVALLLSFGAGIGLAFLLDYLDDSIKTSDDAGRHLGLPTLALIPKYGLGEKKRLRLGRGAKQGDEAVSDLSLVSLTDTRSATAEAYRHLRTSLLFSSAGRAPQAILVTSSQPSEGKTTTAINTAITLAQSGAEVVIIDCDLRRPRLHSRFELSNETGLTNYLSGDDNPEALLQEHSELQNLKIITCGPIPPNPTELLGSEEMRNLLQFLRENFDHVIVDSPPAISFTDAAILSTMVDGVVLVAMAGKSSLQLMKKFKQRLSAIGARIYGVVLNGITSDSVEYGYYGYGYNQYYAHQTEEPDPPDDNQL